MFEVSNLRNEKMCTYEKLLNIKNVSFEITNYYSDAGRKPKSIIEEIIIKKVIENRD